MTSSAHPNLINISRSSTWQLLFLKIVLFCFLFFFFFEYTRLIYFTDLNLFMLSKCNLLNNNLNSQVLHVLPKLHARKYYHSGSYTTSSIYICSSTNWKPPSTPSYCWRSEYLMPTYNSEYQSILSYICRHAKFVPSEFVSKSSIRSVFEFLPP